MGVGIDLRICGEGLVDLGEVLTHTRAIVGDRAPRVDEGHKQNFAFELLKVDRPFVLIQQFEVGNRLARFGSVVLHRGFIVGAALRDDDDVIEFRRTITGVVLLKSTYLLSLRHELKLSAAADRRIVVMKYNLFFMFFKFIGPKIF